MNTAGTFILPRGTARAVLFLVLFFSGVSALIYQIIWIRKFGLVFGVHVFSMSTVLTAFMAGLALGALYFGRLVDKKKNPLLLFMALELGIGLFAIFFPLTFRGLEEIYAAISRNIPLGNYSIQLIRFLLAFLFLLVPTTLMGGTMPVIVKIFTDNIGKVGNRVSLLYGTNNLGAVVGGFLAGFVIIQHLGLNQSGYLAAMLNLLNTVMVFLVVRFAARIEIGMEPQEESDSFSPVMKIAPGVLKLVLWVFAIEGFTTLSYELIWSRILIDFSIDKTVYFSSTIVISFIFGLSLGSFLVSGYLDKRKNLLTLLGLIEILIGLLSVFFLLFFVWIAPKLVAQRSMLDSWFQTAGKEYIIFFLILTPPTLLMGITYPLVTKLAADNLTCLGKRMGLLGFLDTIGSVVGSFVAGFVMIPFLGVVKTFIITVCINLVIGLLVFTFHPVLSIRQKTAITGITLLIALLMMIRIPSGSYTREWWDKTKRSWFDNNYYESILFFDEGAAGTVTVRKYPHGLALNINGHNTAYTTSKDLRVNRQLGYIPYLLHPNPKSALVIGFGMGATACSLVQPDMDRVDVAEICSGVIKAAHVFAPWNRNVILNPKVHLYDDDGRSIVFMTKSKYDIITSNAIHPRLSNNIYTKDFYTLCREKLTENGILCQWMPQNWLTEDEYKALVRAFTEAMPYSYLWYVNEYSTLIIGTMQPLTINAEQISRKFHSNDAMQKDFQEFGVPNEWYFLAQFWFTDQELRNYVSRADCNTDNMPLAEFSKVINIAPVVEVMDTLANHAVSYEEVLTHIDSSQLDSIKFYAMIERDHIRSIARNVRAFMKHRGY
ncbi:MAG: fused MFS/spermidine synthase [Bacteroidales bacterium]